MTSDGGHPTVAVVGPTATGKSDLGVALARELGGEVVNADASQLYRGMDVGTAKLPVEARGGVAHHLLDVLDGLRRGQRRRLPARRPCRRGRRPRAAVACPSWSAARGCTSGLCWSRWSSPAPTPTSAPAGTPGPRRSVRVALHAELAERDPAAAAAIEPANVRRVVRALEVVELTGRPFTATLPDGAYVRPTVQVGLRAPRELLDARIEQRVDAMLAAGLVDEVAGLVPLGLREGRTASRALGYAQVLDHLDGNLTLEQARDETVRATRAFARRQDKWFRRDRRVVWLDATEPPDELLAQALAVVASAVAGDGSGEP